MMSDPSTVDRTAVDELTGKPVLVIDENRAWHETDLLHRQLAAKVKSYVRYARSPDFQASHGQPAEGTIVRLLTLQPPGPTSLAFLARVSYELSKHGLIFEYQLGDDGTPIEVVPNANAVQPPQAPVTPAAPAPPVTPPSPPPAAPPPEPVRPAAPEPPEAEPWATPELSEPPPALEPLELEDSWATPELPEPPEAVEAAGLEFEPLVPGEPADWEPSAVEGASELEQWIESSPDVEFTGATDPTAPEVAAGAGGREATRPPFFPEEEFGRALPEVQEVAVGLDSDADESTAVIETSSGKRIRLDTPTALDDAIAVPVPAEAGPSILRAVGAAIVSALTGAIIWGLLAIPAATGAGPVALAVAIMVGFNVRIRGGGHTIPFRIIGVLGTLFGSALGAVLAAVAVTAMQTGSRLAGAIETIQSVDSVIAAITTQFGLIDIVWLLIAAYLAFRFSATSRSS
jgi:hypothetical protein